MIRNASRAGKEHCTGRYSRMHLSFARILKKEGYLREVVESNDENGHKAITLKLKYVGGLPAITGVQRWSKPGRRQYYRSAEIPRVLGGLGVGILTMLSLGLVACGSGDDQTAGPLQHPRYEHTATLLQDGKVLLAGGLDQTETGIANGEVYNPSTDLWSLTGMMSAARGNYDTTLLPDGRVLAVAGKSSELGNIGSTEAYNPATNQWNWLAADGLTRNAHQVTLLSNGLVMISGGLLIHKRGTFSAYKTIATDKIETTSVQHFDMVTGKTTEARPLPHARKEHTSLLLADGRVLIIGGLVNETVDGPNIDSLNSTEIYDHTSDSWSLGAVMTQGRGLHTATTLPDGKILVTGGLNTARQPLNSAELYDPITDSWAPVGSMSQARDGHTATLLSDGRVLVVGGNGTSTGLSPVSYTHLTLPTNREV